jgi:cytochrome c5
MNAIRAGLVLMVIGMSPAIAAAAAERTGEQIVKAQCAQCHATGLHGAPRLDDRSAWVPRMKAGLDATVQSAIKGHGAMPSRGGMSDLTDSELRSAIVYLFNPAGIPTPPAAAPPLARNQKVVNGTEIFLGVKPVSGDIHQVTITLRDAKTHAAIGDAKVEVKVTNPVMGSDIRELRRTGSGDVVSYGSEFRVSGREPHVISVEVRRRGSSRVIQTQFDYRQ